MKHLKSTQSASLNPSFSLFLCFLHPSLNSPPLQSQPHPGLSVNLSFVPLRLDLPQTPDEDREVGLVTIDPLVDASPHLTGSPPLGSNKRLVVKTPTAEDIISQQSSLGIGLAG